MAALAEEEHEAHKSKEEKQKDASFVEKLTQSIIDNLQVAWVARTLPSTGGVPLITLALFPVQVTVRNVHIRYEDATSNPEHPFSIGVTLHELDAFSTDKHWQPAFLVNEILVHKIAKLDSFGIYFNTVSRGYLSTIYEDSPGSYESKLLSNMLLFTHVTSPTRACA